MRWALPWPMLAMLFALPACAPKEAPPPVLLIPPPDTSAPKASPWTDVASQEEADTLKSMKLNWAVALDQGRAQGFVRAIANEGALLDPEAALPRSALPPGRYQCRVIRIGAAPGTQPRRGQGYAAYKQQYCYVDVEGPLTTFVKETGSERQAGRIWPDNDLAMVFLGAVALGKETAPPGFGTQPDRDLIGVVERIGPLRWRIAMPRPRSQALLDVIELIPFPEKGKF